MTRLAYAVAPLVWGQLTAACVADGSTSEGDSGAGDSSQGDHFQGDLYAGDGFCPPASGFGLDVGDVLESFTFQDCDGNLHSLNDLCSRQAGWIFVYAGWWSSCQERAGTANALYESYSEEDFEAFFIISDKETGAAADAAYCRLKRTQFGLTMPVLIDPTSRMIVPDSDADLVVERGMRIVFNGYYAPESAVAAAIDGALGL